MARRYGIRTRDITLLPIGGVARLERMPRDPAQELRIALAGPAVNVVIAAALSVLILLFAGVEQLVSAPGVVGDLIPALMWVNLTLAAFNLLPAFPMDGGRVLRALLAQRMEYLRATETAASIGQMMAVLFALLGLFTNPILLFIALFVYLGAQAEAQLVRMETAMRGVTVRRAMQTQFETLVPEQSLSHAAQRLVSSSQQDFPVMAEGHVVGLLTRQELLSTLHALGPTARVADAMQRAVSPVAAGAPLQAIFQRMQTDRLSAIPVIEGGRLVGLVTLQSIADFLTVRGAPSDETMEPGPPTESPPAAPHGSLEYSGDGRALAAGQGRGEAGSRGLGSACPSARA
jgi:CBS domain-containing protein